MHGRATAVGLVLLGLGGTVAGCSQDCNDVLIDEAVAFIEQHSSCSSDADCRVEFVEGAQSQTVPSLP